MINIYDKQNGLFLGEITEADLKFLQDHLEEESETDTDYYINADTVAQMEAKGAQETLRKVLKQALLGKDGAEISWARKS